MSNQSEDWDFITAYLSVKKPYVLSYKVSSFTDEEQFADTDEDQFNFQRKMGLFDGVESTFGFDCSGSVSILDDERFPAELKVNSLGVDYIGHSRSGRIGDGWYDESGFLFRLYIPPASVRDIFNKVVFYDRQFTGRGRETDENEGEIKIRLDIEIGAEIRERKLNHTIPYKIVRLYMPPLPTLLMPFVSGAADG